MKNQLHETNPTYSWKIRDNWSLVQESRGNKVRLSLWERSFLREFLKYVGCVRRILLVWSSLSKMEIYRPRSLRVFILSQHSPVPVPTPHQYVMFLGFQASQISRWDEGVVPASQLFKKSEKLEIPIVSWPYSAAWLPSLSHQTIKFEDRDLLHWVSLTFPCWQFATIQDSKINQWWHDTTWLSQTASRSSAC